MLFKKRCRIVVLSLILPFSLLLPLCAHANMQMFETHQSQDRSRTTHNHASDCKCGHQLAEAFQKIDYKPFSGLNAPLTAIFTNDFSLIIDRHLLSERLNLSVSFDDTGPPIHLLNSVFLN